MLELFPKSYWLFVIATALGRTLASQYIAHRLQNKTKALAQNSTAVKAFALFTRLNGLVHLIVLVSIFAMFSITYNYIVPVNAVSSESLKMVYTIGYSVIIFELMVCLISIGIAIYVTKHT